MSDNHGSRTFKKLIVFFKSEEKASKQNTKRIHTTITTIMFCPKVQQKISTERAKVRITLTKGQSKALISAVQMWQQEEKSRKVSDKLRIEAAKAAVKEAKQKKKEAAILEKETKRAAKEANKTTKENAEREKKVRKKEKRREQMEKGNEKAMKGLKSLFVHR